MAPTCCHCTARPSNLPAHAPPAPASCTLVPCAARGAAQGAAGGWAEQAARGKQSMQAANGRQHAVESSLQPATALTCCCTPCQRPASALHQAPLPPAPRRFSAAPGCMPLAPPAAAPRDRPRCHALCLPKVVGMLLLPQPRPQSPLQARSLLKLCGGGGGGGALAAAGTAVVRELARQCQQWVVQVYASSDGAGMQRAGVNDPACATTLGGERGIQLFGWHSSTWSDRSVQAAASVRRGSRRGSVTASAAAWPCTAARLPCRLIQPCVTNLHQHLEWLRPQHAVNSPNLTSQLVVRWAARAPSAAMPHASRAPTQPSISSCLIFTRPTRGLKIDNLLGGRHAWAAGRQRRIDPCCDAVAAAAAAKGRQQPPRCNLLVVPRP